MKTVRILKNQVAIILASLSTLVLTNTHLLGFDRNFFDSYKFETYLSRDFCKMDVIEKEKEYVIKVELPGVKKEDIDLSFNESTIIISCSAEEKSEENGNYLRRERMCNLSSRSIRLNDAKFEKAKAKLDNGILTITVPRERVSENFKKIKID